MVVTSDISHTAIFSKASKSNVRIDGVRSLDLIEMQISMQLDVLSRSISVHNKTNIAVNTSQ